MITVVCSKCGYVFYKGNKLPNLYRIYASVGGRCPRCGSEISWIPREVEIKRSRARS